jgi:hypothetical protein
LGLVADVPQFLCFIDQHLGWNTDCQHTFHHFWRNVHLPFLNSFALSRLKGHEGRYMALFTMSFSLRKSSKTGLTIIDMAIRQTGLSWAV